MAKFTHPANAEDNRGTLSRKSSFGITRVFQSLADCFQGQKLEWLNRRHGMRRHSIPQGIEGNIIQEGSPFGIDLISRFAVGVVVQVPIPSVAGDLSYGIDFVEDIFPVGL